MFFGQTSHVCRLTECLFCHSTYTGFTQDFYRAYHEIHPKSSPHYDERQTLYELYHHLNVSLGMAYYQEGSHGLDAEFPLPPLPLYSIRSCLEVHINPERSE